MAVLAAEEHLELQAFKVLLLRGAMRCIAAEPRDIRGPGDHMAFAACRYVGIGGNFVAGKRGRKSLVHKNGDFMVSMGIILIITT